MSEEPQIVDNLRDTSCLYCGNMFHLYQWMVGSLCMKCSFPSKYSRIIKEMITDPEDKNRVEEVFHAVMAHSSDYFKRQKNGDVNYE